MEEKGKTAEENIRPDFLPSKGKEEPKENLAGKAKEGAKDALKAVEEVALKKGGGVGGNSFLNNVSGKNGKKNGKGGKKEKTGLKKIMAVGGASIAIVMLLIFALVAVIIAIPLIVFATIDYGLQEALGFDGTSAILEEQAEHIVASQLSRGDFNTSYAEDLAKNGIEVGQVNIAGVFVRTNNYLNERGEIATTDEYYDNSSGELSVRFEDKIISAKDFVNEVEANPRLYAAFKNSTDISARYYYSSEVDNVYRDLGLSRNNFAGYKNTGDVEKDKEQFEEIFNSAIKKTTSVGMNGYDSACPESNDSCASGTFTKNNSDFSDGSELVSAVSSSVISDQATEKAASLLNTAVSANEPYEAAGTFLVVEEALNRARIDGDGPVNPLLNTMSEVNSVTITDVKTGEDITTKKSIFKTQNFVAAVSDRSYSVDDAANYSRDRIIQMSDGVSSDIINDTAIASEGSKKSNILVEMKGFGTTDSKINRAANSITTTFYGDALETTKSSIGGNRIVMGGSFLSNRINSRVIGAMPSDEETVARYKEEIDTVLARRAEAERATLSPFDVSSKYTFLGSLVRKIGIIATRNFANSSATGANFMMSVADMFDESVNDLVSNTALAEEDESFMTTNGDCPVANSAAEVVGDIYCTTHNTVDTSRMDWTEDDYKSALSGNIDENGEIVEKSDLAQFVLFGMDRETTVGVKNADICESWKEVSGEQDLLYNFFSNLFGFYESCHGVEPGVANGAQYTISDKNANKDNISLYTSYTLYDTVSSLLDGKKSEVATFKEKYYAEHPLDQSESGVLARRSGMSKGDAETVLAYVGYLNKLARYDASKVYEFGKSYLDLETEKLLFEEHEFMLSLE